MLTVNTLGADKTQFLTIVNTDGDGVKTLIEHAKEEAVIQANMIMHGGAPSDAVDDESICSITDEVIDEVESQQMSRD